MEAGLPIEINNIPVEGEYGISDYKLELSYRTMHNPVTEQYNIYIEEFNINCRSPGIYISGEFTVTINDIKQKIIVDQGKSSYRGRVNACENNFIVFEDNFLFYGNRYVPITISGRFYEWYNSLDLAPIKYIVDYQDEIGFANFMSADDNYNFSIVNNTDVLLPRDINKIIEFDYNENALELDFYFDGTYDNCRSSYDITPYVSNKSLCIAPEFYNMIRDPKGARIKVIPKKAGFRECGFRVGYHYINIAIEQELPSNTGVIGFDIHKDGLPPVGKLYLHWEQWRDPTEQFSILKQRKLSFSSSVPVSFDGDLKILIVNKRYFPYGDYKVTLRGTCFGVEEHISIIGHLDFEKLIHEKDFNWLTGFCGMDTSQMSIGVNNDWDYTLTLVDNPKVPLLPMIEPFSAPKDPISLSPGMATKTLNIEGASSDVWVNVYARKNYSGSGTYLAYKKSVYGNPLTINDTWLSFFNYDQSVTPLVLRVSDEEAKIVEQDIDVTIEYEFQAARTGISKARWEINDTIMATFELEWQLYLDIKNTNKYFYRIIRISVNNVSQQKMWHNGKFAQVIDLDTQRYTIMVDGEFELEANEQIDLQVNHVSDLQFEGTEGDELFWKILEQKKSKFGVEGNQKEGQFYVQGITKRIRISDYPYRDLNIYRFNIPKIVLLYKGMPPVKLSCTASNNPVKFSAGLYGGQAAVLNNSEWECKITDEIYSIESKRPKTGYFAIGGQGSQAADFHKIELIYSQDLPLQSSGETSLILNKDTNSSITISWEQLMREQDSKSNIRISKVTVRNICNGDYNFPISEFTLHGKVTVTINEHWVAEIELPKKMSHDYVIEYNIDDAVLLGFMHSGIEGMPVGLLFKIEDELYFENIEANRSGTVYHDYDYPNRYYKAGAYSLPEPTRNDYTVLELEKDTVVFSQRKDVTNSILIEPAIGCNYEVVWQVGDRTLKYTYENMQELTRCTVTMPDDWQSLIPVGQFDLEATVTVTNTTRKDDVIEPIAFTVSNDPKLNTSGIGDSGCVHGPLIDENNQERLYVELYWEQIMHPKEKQSWIKVTKFDIYSKQTDFTLSGDIELTFDGKSIYTTDLSKLCSQNKRLPLTKGVPIIHYKGNESNQLNANITGQFTAIIDGQTVPVNISEEMHGKVTTLLPVPEPAQASQYGDIVYLAEGAKTQDMKIGIRMEPTTFMGRAQLFDVQLTAGKRNPMTYTLPYNAQGDYWFDVYDAWVQEIRPEENETTAVVTAVNQTRNVVEEYEFNFPIIRDPDKVAGFTYEEQLDQGSITSTVRANGLGLVNVTYDWEQWFYPSSNLTKLYIAGCRVEAIPGVLAHGYEITGNIKVYAQIIPVDEEEDEDLLPEPAPLDELVFTDVFNGFIGQTDQPIEKAIDQTIYYELKHRDDRNLRVNLTLVSDDIQLTDGDTGTHYQAGVAKGEHHCHLMQLVTMPYPTELVLDSNELQLNMQEPSILPAVINSTGDFSFEAECKFGELVASETFEREFGPRSWEILFNELFLNQLPFNVLSKTATLTVTNTTPRCEREVMVQKITVLNDPVRTARVEGLSIIPIGCEPADEWGVYIQGHSRAQITVAAKGVLNCGVREYRVNSNTDIRIKQTTPGVFEMGPMDQPQQVVVRAQIIDQKGYLSKHKVKSFVVHKYEAPSLSNVKAYWSNANGKPDSAGKGIFCKANAQFEHYGYKDGRSNNAAIVEAWYRYKNAVDAPWRLGTRKTVKANEGETGEIAVDLPLMDGIHNNEAYEVKVAVTDLITSEPKEYLFDIPRQKRIVDFRADRGIAFGKFTERQAFEVDLPAYFNAPMSNTVPIGIESGGFGKGNAAEKMSSLITHDINSDFYFKKETGYMQHTIRLGNMQWVLGHVSSVLNEKQRVLIDMKFTHPFKERPFFVTALVRNDMDGSNATIDQCHVGFSGLEKDKAQIAFYRTAKIPDSLDSRTMCNWFAIGIAADEETKTEG